jgi:DNA-binding NtrC family response regulator
MNCQCQVVVASSDLEARRMVAEILEKQGVDPIGCSTIGECREVFERSDASLVFCGRSLADGGYQDLLAACGSARRNVRVVLITSAIDPEEYHSARRSGLFEAISSPCRPAEVEWMVIRAKHEELMRTKGFLPRSFGLSNNIAT